MVHYVYKGLLYCQSTKIFILWFLLFHIFHQVIGLISIVFANGPVNRDSISGRVIPKAQKMVLDPPCLILSIIRFGLKVKWSNPGNGVAPSPTPRCGRYWKGSLQVSLDKSRQLYFTLYSTKIISIFYSWRLIRFIFSFSNYRKKFGVVLKYFVSKEFFHIFGYL